MDIEFDRSRPLSLEVAHEPTWLAATCSARIAEIGTSNPRSLIADRSSWGRYQFNLGLPRSGSKLEVRVALAGAAGTPFEVRYAAVQDRGNALGSWDYAGTLGAEGHAVLITSIDFEDSWLRVRTASSHRQVFPSDRLGTRGGLEEVAASEGVASDDEQRRGEFQVHYATNRQPVDPTDHSKGYSSSRDTKVHYGICEVFVPEAHKIGSIGSSWWKRLLTLTDDRLKVRKIQRYDEAVYWTTLASKLQALAEDERDAVVFVHGYNVSFAESALRAAQLGVDLGVKGAMAFYSWPSRGNVGDYSADEATIEASEGFIAGYLTDFAQKSGARMVHLIAHSMGNRGVLRAIDRITQIASSGSSVRFGQIILAAADVDADTFRQLAVAYKQVSARTTLYVSTRDRAVEASGWLHDFPRAGLMPPVVVMPEIDTINVANADLTMLGHGYVASARGVLADMHSLISTGHPPGRRFGIRQASTDKGEIYWLIGA